MDIIRNILAMFLPKYKNNFMIGREHITYTGTSDLVAIFDCSVGIVDIDCEKCKNKLSCALINE